MVRDIKIVIWLLFAFLMYALCGCCWTKTYYESGELKESRIEVYAPIRLENVSGVELTIN